MLSQKRNLTIRTATNERRATEFLSGTTATIRLFALVFLATGCGKSGGNSMTLKWPGMDKKDLPVKSSYGFAVSKTFTDINRNITT